MFGDLGSNRRYVLRFVLSRAPSREAVDGTRYTRWLRNRLGVRGDNRDALPRHIILASGGPH